MIKNEKLHREFSATGEKLDTTPQNHNNTNNNRNAEQQRTEDYKL
jgi:hypothetical protein